ncbi:ATP-citrate synthase [Portunus trituberculatus]|uniref:ATP-citrate synthase n=1 Tax=Portunus trituberculatus TaxID=210409 RepID=A0A5B7DAC7_PORTR|nr:ATP-citrate synthase [Portunus trituberculatus]
MLQKLVVKPDQLIKRRGKLGLIKVGTDLAGVQSWVDERMNKDQQTRDSYDGKGKEKRLANGLHVNRSPFRTVADLQDSLIRRHAGRRGEGRGR